ncbi:MAG: hypothetical protein ACJA07_002565 [Rhodococcus sp. (in: high G+C Gram-positive bacteria)]
MEVLLSETLTCHRCEVIAVNNQKEVNRMLFFGGAALLGATIALWQRNNRRR